MKTLLANAGYIFATPEHGAFAPDGKVAPTPDADTVAHHNADETKRTLAAMAAMGRAILYLSNGYVSTWGGSTRWLVDRSATSWHNMAGKDGRTDVWFIAFDAHWHGVNIGDNEIVRCRRIKS